MLSFSFLYRCNVQREQAGIALMIMREEILCKRLYPFPHAVDYFVVLCFARILDNHYMTITITIRFSNKIQHKIAKKQIWYSEFIVHYFLYKISTSWFTLLIFDPYIAETDSSAPPDTRSRVTSDCISSQSAHIAADYPRGSGAKTINVFRACLGAQLTICAQK